MTEKKTKKDIVKIDVEEMQKLGLQLGHRTSRIHPKMNPYISGVRGSTHIIDLEKTKEKLTEALDFIQDLRAQGKILLLVGTKIQAQELIKETAEACGLPYVSERWLGGTFTNLPAILKRIDYYKELERKKASGELEKYTKKERANFDKELKNLENKFAGIKSLTKLADAIFVCDMLKDKLAVKEAKIRGVKIVAICDTNADPSLVDYPIPASDDAISSVKYILEKIKEVVLKLNLKRKNLKRKNNMVSVDKIKQLREDTGVSVSECQKALKEAKDDMAKAKEILKQAGKLMAEKKANRETSQGIVDSYIHPNKKVGVLLELNSETDFVAKSPDFQALAHELCLQIAAFEDEETALLEQPWIKDQAKTVKNLLEEYILKLGENITVKRFVRYKL